ncbi:MAG: hypothetical protein GY772_21050, partial [bacterium]|nr:hypothetical protein [bacterium]
MRNVRGMVAPMSLQRLRVAAQRGEAVWLAAEGAAGVQDVAALAPWRTLRSCLRLWDRPAVGGASSSSTMALEYRSTGLVAARAWDFAKDDLPCCVLLDRLLEEGWRVTPRDQRLLTPDSARTFRATNATRRKAYLQCLVVLPDLFQAGLPALPSGLSQQFYRDVLAADDPASIALPVGDLEEEAAPNEGEGQDEPAEEAPARKRRRKTCRQDFHAELQAALWSSSTMGGRPLEERQAVAALPEEDIP